MRINRFYESINELEDERCNDIIDQLSDFLTYMVDKQRLTEELLNELEPYKDKSKEDYPINKALSSIRETRVKITESIEKIDNIIGNLKDYSEKGQKNII